MHKMKVIFLTCKACFLLKIAFDIIPIIVRDITCKKKENYKR